MGAGHYDARNCDDDTQDDDDDSNDVSKCIAFFCLGIGSHDHYTDDNDDDSSDQVEDEPSKPEPFVESQVADFT